MPPKRKVEEEDEDELMSDDDSEYEDDPSAQAGSSSRPGGAVIPGKLSAPVIGTMSCIKLYKTIKNQGINLDIEFQRDVVWNETKQSYLILSLLQNFPIPPVYLSLRQDLESNKQYWATLDGKQRLTSIYKFFEGKIGYIAQGSKTKLYYKDISAKGNRKLVPRDIRAEIEQKELTCVQYSGLTNVQERDMFQRVQLGVPLTPGERLQSLSGDWADWIRELMWEFVESKDGNETAKKLADQLDWDVGRGAGFVCLTSLICNLSDMQNNTLKSYTVLSKWLQSRPSKPPAGFKKSVEDVLRKFLTIAKSNDLSYPFRAGTPRVAPIEFTMIGVLIYLMRDRSMFEITKEIDNLRTTARKTHVDVRSNSRVMATMWAFCKNVGGGPMSDAEYTGTPAQPAAKKKRTTVKKEK